MQRVRSEVPTKADNIPTCVHKHLDEAHEPSQVPSLQQFPEEQKHWFNAANIQYNLTPGSKLQLYIKGEFHSRFSQANADIRVPFLLDFLEVQAQLDYNSYQELFLDICGEESTASGREERIAELTKFLSPVRIISRMYKQTFYTLDDTHPGIEAGSERLIRRIIPRLDSCYESLEVHTWETSS